MGANKTIVSKQFNLKARDFAKGFIMAVGTPTLYILQEMIPGWDIQPIYKAGISAGVTYLLKNFFDKPKVVITAGSNADAEDLKETLK